MSRIRTVQIAGSDPVGDFYAARISPWKAAPRLLISLWGPAKKVNRKLAGSALCSTRFSEVYTIVVVNAVDAVPVTLKIRNRLGAGTP